MSGSALCVIDTSAWVEWLVDSPVGEKVGACFPSQAHCIVPTIVQLELAQWMVREVGEDEADQVLAYTQKCQVVALDTTIALLAASLHREHKLATADAIVYATALHTGAKLISCDAHFSKLPRVIYIAKS